jgi:hypothetical protein
VSHTPFGNPPESIQSGYYGNPPNAWWWLKQSIIYFIGLFGMKICVLIIFLAVPEISKVGDWALRWTEGNERLQIAFVMMIFPLIMNALQYYIIDSFIKKKESGDHERLSGEDPDSSRQHHDDALLGEELLTSSDSDDEEDRGAAAKKKKPRSKAQEDEYDPEVDGDAPTVVGTSFGSRPGTSASVPRELLPKE